MLCWLTLKSRVWSGFPSVLNALNVWIGARFCPTLFYCIPSDLFNFHAVGPNALVDNDAITIELGFHALLIEICRSSRVQGKATDSYMPMIPGTYYAINMLQTGHILWTHSTWCERRPRNVFLSFEDSFTYPPSNLMIFSIPPPDLKAVCWCLRRPCIRLWKGL